MKALTALLVLLASAACSANPRRSVIVLCAGDSLTEQGYPDFLKDLLRADGFRARVLNYGRSGNSSKEYLRYLTAVKEKLDAARPDFIMIQLGTNDVRTDGDRVATADFIDNINRILDVFSGFKTRTGDPSSILIAAIPPLPEGVPFPFSPESRQRVENEINPALTRIARERRIPLVDNYGPFLKSPELLPAVHPTDEGYRLMARNWYRAIRNLMTLRD